MSVASVVAVIIFSLIFLGLAIKYGGAIFLGFLEVIGDIFDAFD